MPTPDWNALLGKLASATEPADILDEVAGRIWIPPPGEVTRALLTPWARCSRPLSGGAFLESRTHGRRVDIEREEPFLSVVLGPDASRADSALRDLKSHDAEAHWAAR